MTRPAHIRPWWIRWLPAVLWAAVIFIGSSFPGSSVPGGFSVYGHLGEYAVLALLVLFAERHRGFRTSAIIALAAVALYGASDEFHQLFVPLRMSDPVDWLTDIAGALAAIAAYAGVRALAARRRALGRTGQG
jgi:VanZ family protein